MRPTGVELNLMSRLKDCARWNSLPEPDCRECIVLGLPQAQLFLFLAAFIFMIIGITGAFGSGKSTAARMLSKMIHAKIIDADKIAKKEIEKRAVINRIGEAFPVVIGGRVSRKQLAAIVFSDRIKLEILERIMHPLVIKEIKKKAKASAIIDAPLLVEAKLHRICDTVIVVKCMEKTRIDRLIRKGFSLQEIKARTKMQLPVKAKLRYADYVINNSRSLKETRKQIKNLLARL